MSGARVQARFTDGELDGANFSGADISAHLANQSMGLMHTEIGGAKLKGADFSHTNMGHADLSYADVEGANFAGADLTRADLTGGGCPRRRLFRRDAGGRRDGGHEVERREGARHGEGAEGGARVQAGTVSRLMSRRQSPIFAGLRFCYLVRMRRDEAIEKLKAFEPRLRALGATSLFLFGSTARDEAKPDSDLDLFLEYDAAAKFSIFELVEAKHMFEDELARSVDVATRNGLHPLMRDEIEREAIRIF